MARTTKEILDELQVARARNKGLYTFARDMLETDDTLALVKRMYDLDPKAAREWHRLVLSNDERIVELTRELTSGE